MHQAARRQVKPWPDVEDLLTLLAESTGPDGRVRDAGILVAVATRPHARLLGGRAYPPSSIKQLPFCTASPPGVRCRCGMRAWAATLTMIDGAGFVLTMPVREQMALVDAIGTGTMDNAEEAALLLAPYLRLR